VEACGLVVLKVLVEHQADPALREEAEHPADLVMLD
jgi:hypothetical protein